MRPMARGWRSIPALRLVLVLAILCVLCPLGTVSALADGDPGSDVLLDQNLFYGSDSGISTAQELALGKLLTATAAAGAPVRVAIVAHEDDLGSVTRLWQRPEAYAGYLGYELSLAYTGRLLVVMPGGYGIYWRGHNTTSASRAIASAPAPGASPASLIAGATAAVKALEMDAGVAPAKLRAVAGTTGGAVGAATTSAAAPSPTAGVPTVVPAAKAHGWNGWVVAVVLIVVLTSVFWAPWLWRRRHEAAVPGIPAALGAGRDRIGVPYAVVIAPVVLVVALAFVIHSQGNGVVSNLANNPNLDSGSVPNVKNEPGVVPRAPNFKLVDESGQSISLKQYRGKVVVLSFIDSECQTVCPLTSAAMLDAKQSLGSAGKEVQLLAVNANWKSIQVDDVANYTQLHGLLGRWHFLTGTLGQLNRVWTAYGVNEFKLAEKDKLDSNLIDHVVATFVIDPAGKIRMLFQSVTSYAAIPQLGQLIAREAAKLLPSHPKVETHYSYADITGIGPSASARLPLAGGGSIQIGPGHPHMYVFFDTWDTQTTPIAAELDELNAYARAARKLGLPTPVAIDEASVEPSPSALPAFLASLPSKLDYPVAIDTTGKVADGYDVQGEPWFVLTTQSGGRAWYREVYTSVWPSEAILLAEARASLHPGSISLSQRQVQAELAGSPARLASLHRQASHVLSGGQAGLDARIRSLKGYPIVLNIWGSWCPPCQEEFPLFARASAAYGKHVAFLGADTQETIAGSGQNFLSEHHVSYPSYETTDQSLDAILIGGLESTPTTVYIGSDGKIEHTNFGQYDSYAALQQDIEQYALGG